MPSVMAVFLLRAGSNWLHFSFACVISDMREGERSCHAHRVLGVDKLGEGEGVKPFLV